jgi:hypothetical protein
MISFRSAQMGDVFPASTARGIWAADWEPSWFIFTVPPRGEMPASAWLTRNGTSEVWYPSETAFKRNRFKPGQRIPYERPVAPGYLFAVLPSRPHWDVLFSRSRGKLLRVVSHNGEPVAVPEGVIASMAQVPQRLATIREAEREKRMVKPGDKVAVQIGGVEWTVEVNRIHEGIASFVIPLLGGREVQAPVDSLVRQPPLA